MLSQATSFRCVLLAGVLALLAGCERSQPPASSQVPAVPADLKEAVATLVRAIEAFDLPTILAAYADDFISGTGRSKDEVRNVITQLRANYVALKVESADIKEAGPDEAKLETRLRLRYTDRFRDLGEGEVVITDILVHSLRKTADRWQIYTDERIATYREGRFGDQPPNVAVEVPEKVPTDLYYPVKVVVRRESDKNYQVMIGNYAEDPATLPPPDIITTLPEDGIIQANLLPNPQGRSEMVRITVIAEDLTSRWLGATTVSKLVPGAQRRKQEAPQEAV